MLLIIVRNILLFWKYHNTYTDHIYAIDCPLGVTYTGQNYNTFAYNNYTTDYL